VAIVWSLIGASEHGWTSARTVGGIVLGIGLLAVLVLVERRVEHPLLRLELFSSQRRVVSFIAIVGLVGAQFSTFYLSVRYLQGVLHFGPLASGLAFLPLSLSIFGMSRISPRIAARIGMPAMLLIGAIGTTLSFVWLSQLGAHSSYAGSLLVPFIINGAFASMVFTASMAIGLEGVDAAHAGAASGLVQTMQQLGGSVGLAVIASVYVANGRQGEIVPGMQQAFIAAAFLGSIGVAAALTTVLRGRVRQYALGRAVPEAD
jgi:predicted MFS family arabinose efflux permease